MAVNYGSKKIPFSVACGSVLFLQINGSALVAPLEIFSFSFCIDSKTNHMNAGITMYS
jgi:hypothetical protein